MNQQEFLEQLTDPIRASFDKAEREILVTYGDIIQSITIMPYNETSDYLIQLHVLDADILPKIEADCINIFTKHVNGLIINISDYPVRHLTTFGYSKLYHASWR